jgi:outer membrane lipoprotein-sorting protein
MITRTKRIMAWLALALACGGVAAGHARTAPPAPEVSRVFAQRLAKAGRAEAPITRRFEDPFTGKPVAMRGRLALEPPDRARIDFEETGERVTLRADGGEWLQPQLGQMLRFDGARTMAALRWWAVFGRVTGLGFTARRIGPREWILTMAEAGAPADSARVTLDAAGLPAVVEISEEAGGQVRYEIGAWRFTSARGRGAFEIQLPKGYEVFDLR